MSTIQKAYIIRISSELSREYANIAAKSCEALDIPYEFFDGIEDKNMKDAWEGYRISRTNFITDRSACASASHAKLWRQIYDRKECAIILEHDVIMLHRVLLDIPDNMIVTLGFKVRNPEKYNHLKAGSSTNIIKINEHHGAHAYAITCQTAKLLLDELETVGVQGDIDNVYFMKNRRTRIPLGLIDPISALGWVRQSTIWDEAAELNYFFTPSFKNNFNK